MCTNVYQNRLRFVEDMTKIFGVFLSVHSVDITRPVAVDGYASDLCFAKSAQCCTWNVYVASHHKHKTYNVVECPW